MSITRLNNSNALHARHVEMRNNTVTVHPSEAYQQFLVFTQRCGLYMVWNLNGTWLDYQTVLPVQGLSFAMSGSIDFTITWASTDNLHVTLLSYAPFEMS